MQANGLTIPAIKKKLKAEMNADYPMRVVDFGILDEFHLIRWILSLTKADGAPPVYSTYNQHRAGFNHLYRMYRQRVPAEITSELPIYFKSLRKRAARNAHEGNGLNVNTKLPLPFRVYKFLAYYFFTGVGVVDQQDALQNVFGHLFLLLSWNTMQRAHNTAEISLTHLKWNEDSLQVFVCQAKNDQEGDKASNPKHTFANPVSPEICPILSLGIFFSLVVFNPTDSKLFQGTKQDDRFRKLIKRFVEIEMVTEGLQELGFDRGKMGIHSIRKGSSTYCVSGTINPPPQASIDIRGGWSQGKIKDVYQHFQSVGDQYVGRTVCGLPRTAVDFATLPPHFKFGESRGFVKECVQACFPTLPESLQTVASFCLASLVYHSEFLRNTLSGDHILFSTPLFRRLNLLNGLKNLVVCELPTKNGDMSATGIPVDILHTLEIRRVPIEVERILEERTMLANSVTPAYMSNLLDAHYERFRSLYCSEPLDTLTPDHVAVSAPTAGSSATRTLHWWDGHCHLFKENYRIPKVTVFLIWQHWWLGDTVNDVPPLRIATGKDLKQFKLFSELKFLMQKMEANISDLESLKANPSIKLVNAAFEENPLNLNYHARKRPGQLMWTTIARNLRMPASNPE